jgi:hypothetical protein
VIQGDFRKQPLKAEPVIGRGCALTLMLVDDENPLARPAELNDPVDQSVLAVGGIPVLGDLLRGGLADVNNRQSVEMPGLGSSGKARGRVPAFDQPGSSPGY